MPDNLRPSGKFTKADLTDALYEETRMNRADIRHVIDLITNKMKEALINRQIIELRGFGTFEVKIRKTRKQARNPRTGESIVVHPHGVVAFRSGRELKQAVRAINEQRTENNEQ